MNENKIQKSVAKHFRSHKGFGDTFVFYSVPGGSVRVTPWIGKHLKEMGCLAGVHDLVFLGDKGKTIFIELKTEGRGLSDSQKYFHGIITKLGHASYVIPAKDGEEAIKRIETLLKVHGLIL